MLLEINNLSFGYSAGIPLFENFSLQMREGEAIALAGASGCGKSTLLGLIYGTLQWERGQIFFGGKEIFGPRANLVPGEEGMKYVAQNFDLMPYSTVQDNVGKYLSNIDPAAKRAKVLELLRVVGLEDFANVKPQFLSGGQQQRVAIARALSVVPKLLLLDEPFSSLDFSRKADLRDNVFGYARDHNIALILSTHDLPEIMPWADRIVILKEGKIVENGMPENIYRNPANAYVAQLFGEVNVFTDEEKRLLGIHKNMYFPHQVAPAETGMEAEILESRFAGSHYRNRAVAGGTAIILHSARPLRGRLCLRFED